MKTLYLFFCYSVLPLFLTAQTDITIVSLSKVAFEVHGKHDYPLTFEYQGITYHNTVPAFREGPAVESFARRLSIDTAMVRAIPIKIKTNKSPFDLKSKITVIKTAEDYNTALVAWTLRYNHDREIYDTLIKFERSDKAGMIEAVAEYLEPVALENLKSLIDLYQNDVSYTLEQVMDPILGLTNYKTIHPQVKIEAGISISGYAYVPGRNFSYKGGIIDHLKLSISPLSEWTPFNFDLIKQRIFITGTVQRLVFEINPLIAGTLSVPSDLVDAVAFRDRISLTNSKNIIVTNSIAHVGAQYSTFVGKTFSFFVEGGVSTYFTDYTLKFKNPPGSYFNNDGRTFIDKPEFKVSFAKKNSFTPYYSFGISFALAKIEKLKLIKRGPIISASIIHFNNQLEPHKNEVLISSFVGSYFRPGGKKSMTFSNISIGWSF